MMRVLADLHRTVIYTVGTPINNTLCLLIAEQAYILPIII
ncbi:hypothetical protein Clocl_0851 [Acetivibrio clariflavus DSM 19732]|uniref:Uncharacterized protein n=1 Tax=Acetivibrio clariflavus (strain DSM 19732 / NBRC 101661 / EBR45) TaxID=720554 RepID=G8LVX1_ACECE|nr:hypothetical protein Clocl_0851 [Acetivibrio clariflavus DSM 19732]